MDVQFIILPIDICRICTNLQPSLNILTETLEDENVLLHEALEFVSCMKTDFDDGMSETMCTTCSKRLSDAYKFKNQILDSYRTFYNQTSDLNFKKENDENNSELLAVEEKNSINVETQMKSAFDIECVNELGIHLSTHAVSFLLEHNNCKTQKKIKVPEQHVTEKDEVVTNETQEFEICIDSMPPTQTEENEPLPIENNEVECIELYAIEDNQQEQTESISSEKENNETSPTQSIKTYERKRTLSDRKNSTYSDMQPNSKIKPEDHKFSCHICYKTLCHRSNLEDHLRLHANEKNYVCSFCQKVFVKIASYRTHLRVHNREKPYHCHFCPKTFSQGASLRTHIRSHTNSSDLQFEL